MQVQYEGGPYFGFASQTGECEETVEKHIFEAMLKTRLIESRGECGYTRCGRTDRGVSALGQVVAFNVRSALPPDLPADALPKHICDAASMPAPAAAAAVAADDADAAAPATKPAAAAAPPPVELDYCAIINRCLPEHIRVLAWCPVSPEFSARFSAASRTYRYFFSRKRLDLGAMRAAAQLLLGRHDFRNLCKMDMANVTNFCREIFSADIVHFSGPADGAEGVWMLEIRGVAFLWHMVRCIMAILLLVGEGREPPSIVSSLLDVAAVPGKPQYTMAAEGPLVLHHCSFDRLDLQHSPRALYELCGHFEGVWDGHTVAAARARNVLLHLNQCRVRASDVRCFGAERKSFLGGKARGRDGGQGQAGEQGSRKRAKAEGETPLEGSSSSSSSSANTSSLLPPSGDDSMSFAEALLLLERDYALPHPHPSSAPAAAHIPLLQRKLADCYEERKSALGGGRKERLDRHLQLQQEERDGGFFERMRAQGSV